MLLAAGITVLALWAWLITKAWRVGPIWGGLTVVVWPVASILLLRDGGRDNQLRMPFILLCVASVVFGKLWLDDRERQLRQLEQVPIPITEVVEFGTDDADQDVSGDDTIPARVRWQRAIDSLSFRHGEVELRPAKASIRLPDSFKFVGRAGTARALAVLEHEPADEMLGWVVHQSVDLAKDDAWTIEVKWWGQGFLEVSSLAEIAPERMWIAAQYTHKELGELREREGLGGYELVEFGVAPRLDNSDLVYWAKRMSYKDGSEGLDCHAIKRGRYGWLEFVSRFMPTDQLELCLRSVRAIASRSRFEHGAAVRDATRGELPSSTNLVDLITGRQLLTQMEARQ